jgi:hypothetical protein
MRLGVVKPREWYNDTGVYIDRCVDNMEGVGNRIYADEWGIENMGLKSWASGITLTMPGEGFFSKISSRYFPGDPYIDFTIFSISSTI